MKAQSSILRLKQFATAGFGLLRSCSLRLGVGRRRLTVISGPFGLYFLPSPAASTRRAD